MGSGQGHRGFLRGDDREHGGREGHRRHQGRREEGLQEGPGWSGQPSQVRLLRGHVELDLPERRVGAVEPEDPLRQRAHLHLLGALLYRCQPIQG